MHGQRTETAGRLARWLLLSCTLFGLAAMHTLGHVGPGVATHDPGAAMTVAPGGVHERTAVSAGDPADCPDGHCDGHGPGGWSVCLAVLGGLAALVLLAALLTWSASRRSRARTRGAGGPAASRGPPRRPAGLTLASVAVLRV